MSQTVERKEVIYEFDEFVLDPNERILLAGGKPIHLTDKVFDTLLLLIQHNGRLVTKDEMMSAIWDESFVEEGNLAKNISRLRKILNVNGTSLIETLPRRGYRFAADVKEIDGDTSLLVRRNLRVKITQTEEDESSERKGEGEQIKLIERVAPSRQSRLPIVFAAILLLALVSGLGFYFWKGEKKAPRDEAGVIRLTDDPADDFWPKWTQDGRIRFYRMGSDKKGKHMLMNADGTDQTEAEPGFWSPDGTKVLVWKPGDKTAVYLRNADGSNELSLPPMGNTTWSADSKKIVYQLSIGENKNSELFIYSLETGNTENITNSPSFDADPSFSPDGNQVVFASTRDGNAEVYLMNSDGSDVRRLTNNPSWDNHPLFSPDGTAIAFNSDRENENEDVYLMNVDGSNLKKLTNFDKSNETVEPGSWSPDGTKIAFYSNMNGNDDIYLTSAEVYKPRLVLADEEHDLQFPSYSPDGKKMVYQIAMPDKSGELSAYDVESKQSRILLKTENTDLGPAFSPDGSQIVFQNKTETNTEICLINADGSNLTNLTQNSARDILPSFSPDGRQIAFTTNREGNTGIYRLYVMNNDGSDQRRVYSGEGLIYSPVWSADGRKILFARDADGTGNFQLVSIDAEDPDAAKQITFRHRFNGQPVFSPDDRRIAFASDADGNSEIYLMNADGSRVLRLTRSPADDSSPHWSPDGRRIIFTSNRNGKYALYEIEVDQ